MFTLTIENYRGDKITLFPSNDYYVELDGITGNKAEINTSVTGNGSGSMFNSSRTDERAVSLTIFPLRNIEENRIRLYRFFQSGKAVTLYYTNGTRNAFLDGYVEQAPSGDLFTEQEALEVSIKCPSPFWKSGSNVITDVSDIRALFTFEFSIENDTPISFSEIEIGTEKTVYNSGDVESGIIIELNALDAVSNPTIYDEFGGAFGLTFDMNQGDVITINTYRGEKSVKLLRDGVESNIFPYVNDNPKWFSLLPGDNLFSFTASDTARLKVRFITYNLYEGI